MKKRLLFISAILLVILCVACVLLFAGKDEFTVTFLDQQGAVLQEAVYQKGETLSVPQDPSMEGHSFAGWVLDGSEEVYDFDKDGARTVRQNLRFTAKFTPNSYTVKFIAANGSDLISQGTYTYGEKLQVPEAPKRKGYNFVGWMKQGEQAMYDFNADGAASVKSDAAFVAQYEAIRCKVVFADHDGSVYKTQTYRFGEYFAVPEAPAREGYLFMGWALSGETEPYDFEKEDAKLVGDQDISFVAIYDKLETVAGSLYKVDGTALPQQLTILFGKIEQTVIVGRNGAFTTQLPAGKYTVAVKLDGYTSVCGDITVKAGRNSIGDIKLLQSIASDMVWWEEGKLVQHASSVTITMPSKAHPDAGHEFKIGASFQGASSWKAGAHISKGAFDRRGFTFGTAKGGNAPLFVYIDSEVAGFYTWGTFRNDRGQFDSSEWVLSDEVKAMLQADGGYDLSLVATNIRGEGTGWLTLYVNDVAVARMENTFVSVEGPHIQEGVRLDLGAGHISLAVRGAKATATFTDYYYAADVASHLKIGTIRGKLEKLDGTAMPGTVVFDFGLFRKNVTVHPDGSFETTVPVGDYEVMINSVSQKISVAEGTNSVGTIKLLQTLTSDMGWWQGAELTVDRSSAVIQVPADANTDAGHEFRVGEYINDASSWKIAAHIAPGARGRHGFSVGTTGANGTVFFFLEGDRAGYYTWWTYLNQSGGTEQTWVLPEAAKNAIASADGYDLSLVGTNIYGEGTGWLTLYVNDIAVVRVANTFVGGKDSPHVTEGAKLNLSKVHLSLTVRGSNSTATFSDYYYTVNSEKDLTLGKVTGSLTKLDGTDVPATVVLTDGLVQETVPVDGAGKLACALSVGSYQLVTEGYRSAVGDIAVKAGDNNVGEIKLLQTLTSDMGWWQGGVLTENGSTASISIAGDANGDAGHEFRVGEYINDASSWKIAAHIAPGARGRHGFSVGTTGANGTVFFFLEGDRAGYYTWWTYLNQSGGTEQTWVLPEAAKNAIASADGYDLSLVGTNIHGEGTGWLTLYVNEIPVVKLENIFVGGGGPHIAEGAKLNLSKVHLSLAVRGNNATATFGDYYYKVNSETALALNTVTGSVVKVDGSALPAKLELVGDLVSQTVTVNADGSFTAAVPEGEYAIRIPADGYRQSVDQVTVVSGENNVGTIKLLQNLTSDMGWWQGGVLTENGSTANISIAGDANGDAGHEFRVGEYINDASSWRISAHIAPGARGRHGFSVGTTGANGTVFFFLEGDRAGYYTWWTYLNKSGGAEQTWVLPEAAKNAIASANGYDLSLVGTNIHGEGTGWLTLYVNDMMVVRIPNDFAGGAGSPHVGEGAKLNLSKVHLSLAVRGNNSAASYSDYYYTVDQETAPALQELNKDMEWWSGCTLTQDTGSATISIAGDASGDAGLEVRIGDYINDASAWRASAHIAPGARGRHGLSVGTTGANGTVFFFLDGNRAGYYTWWTYLNQSGGTEETWELPEAAKTAIQSDDGYYLSLAAANINGEGTGTLVLYVNEIAVVEMENIFVGGGGPHIAEGAKLNLSKVHLSLAVRGNNSTATFREYFAIAE